MHFFVRRLRIVQTCTAREVLLLPCVIFVGNVFICAKVCVHRIALLVCSVIASCVVGIKRHPAYGDSIVEAILIHSESIRRRGHHFKRAGVFGTIFVSDAFSMRADSVICLGCILKKKCCQGKSCNVSLTVILKLLL